MINDFYTAWHFLREHLYFSHLELCDDGIVYMEGFEESLDITVVKVNPEIDMVDDDNKKNTKTQVWLECGPYSLEDKTFSHDTELDTGGNTFEEAIINLANLVQSKYGNKSISDYPNGIFITDEIKNALAEMNIEIPFKYINKIKRW